jgi:hypothetical protein
LYGIRVPTNCIEQLIGLDAATDLELVERRKVGVLS